MFQRVQSAFVESCEFVYKSWSEMHDKIEIADSFEN